MAKGVWFISFVMLLLPVSPSYGGIVDTTLYQAVDREFSGSRAFEDVAYFTRHWRIAGGTAFNTCMAYIMSQLSDAGFNGQTSHSASFQVDEEPIDTPVWKPEGGSLETITPDKNKLHSFDETPALLCVNSFPTRVTAEVVYVGAGSRGNDYRNVEVKGKIVLGRGAPRMMYQRAVVERGALGILSGYVQGYNRPDRFPDAIHTGEIPYDPERKAFGMMVSTTTFKQLLHRLNQGLKVTVNVRVDAAFAPGVRRTLVAEIPGRKKTQERVVIVSHLDHYKPGANDNASGASTVLEIARTMSALIDRGEIPPPDRTITFLWVDEYKGTTLWMKRHPDVIQDIQAVFVLDMVGEKTEVTGGSFRLERMPDPSAIWLRPPDEHTPWGAGAVDRAQIHGHYLNDYYLSVCRQRAEDTGWEVRTNPWEGGSDHDVFLKEGVPAVLSWHFPDYFYHTSLDDLDKVDPLEMKHVGVAAATATLTLASANNHTARRMLDIIETSAAERFGNEERNSLQALTTAKETGQNFKRQQHREQEILSAWQRWYEETLDSVAGVPVEGADNDLLGQIDARKQHIQNRLKSIQTSLARIAPH